MCVPTSVLACKPDHSCGNSDYCYCGADCNRSPDVAAADWDFDTDSPPTNRNRRKVADGTTESTVVDVVR